MQRIETSYSITNISLLKEQLLVWGNTHQTVAWLDSNQNSKATTEGLLAVGVLSSLETDVANAFAKLKTYVNKIEDYVFGYLSYDLKNDIEPLHSYNIDETGFPDLFFFQPKKLIEISSTKITFKYPKTYADEIAKDWLKIQKITKKNTPKQTVSIHARINKETYVKQVQKALQKIHIGEVYELNFCQEFYAKNAKIHPLETYLNLNKISAAPFATYLKFKNLYLLSGSPERFLQKKGNTITSEPIKGTAKRLKDAKKDQNQILALKNNPKEIAENIMIVDLVRNDLSHIAQKGSVQVKELCQVYTFKQVHQMISTITCNMQPSIHPVDAIKACYPMGSMTGAPKIAAMHFIEDLETSKRGIYSGAVGYFTPEQDFDFNVVIRSILYNQPKQYLSFSVGSAITAQANPEKEYEECLLKAKAMREVLSQ